jgi:signal transduction histidine kinase
MLRKFYLVLVLPALLLTGLVWAADYGTPAEAKAMLEKVVADMKKDPTKTLAMINKGDFKDRDLYPFCGGPDGKFTGHPKLVGQSMKDLKDKTGTPIGEEFYKVAQEGKIAEVSYRWPRPNETEPVHKVAYVTKVGDQVCAVGYYKQ